MSYIFISSKCEMIIMHSEMPVNQKASFKRETLAGQIGVNSLQIVHFTNVCF